MTALVLLTVGVLMGASVLFSRAAGKTGVPVALLFLIVGMIAGEDGLLGIRFEDFGFAFRVGTTALVLILFDGGLNTPLSSLKQGLRPALVLATVGVAGTAGFLAIGARLLGFTWGEAFLIGAIVSSTDAAAVFTVLRSSGIHLKKRLGTTLELESGLNDPMAVILTMAATQALVAHESLGWGMLLDVVIQLGVGAGLGIGIGFAGRFLIQRSRLSASGMYTVMTVAVAFIAFGVPTLVWGSGFLAVYLAGMTMGNGKLPYRTGLLRVHDSLAWLAQIMMFLLLGLLVTPSALVEVAVPGLALGLILAFLARPAVTAPILAAFRFKRRETLYASWVGLRGAVPIILATIPILAGVPGTERIFNIVFFIVVVNAFLPGATVQRVTRWLRLEAPEPPPPAAVLEIASSQILSGDVLSFYVDSSSAVAGSVMADLPFPEGAAVMLVVRGNEMIAPKGQTRLDPGDHVYVFCRPTDRPFVQLMFGRTEES
ncbi:potassium/proton antiporter [Vulgatibacter sp.]|uniref:potassium/proton antiporter n=1 Tax=Vulgatibacter sp. TaxID=1971226 RepID=UPI00356567BC